MTRLYYRLLWVLGFRDDDDDITTDHDREKITFILRRMRQRNPAVWWTLIIGAVTTSLGLLAFFVWLLLHVIWTPFIPN